MTSPDVHDSPTGWVADHIRHYVDSAGTDGHDWRGVPTLLLTTTGRRTGQRRRTALIYGKRQSDYIVVASSGGAEHHPAWYLNLQADPTVEIQVMADIMQADAHTASADERPALWDQMVSLFGAYAQYQARTERTIPVVILTPQAIRLS
jgi:deazaflavin-dependent oxidoreductase (nitroreductase family)